MKKLLLISLLLLTALNVGAVVLPYYQGVLPNQQFPTPGVGAYTKAYITPTSSITNSIDLKRMSMVTLKVDHHNPSFYDPYVAVLTVKVTRYPDITSGTSNDTTIVLTVSYQPNTPDSLTFVDKHSITLLNAEKIDMNIMAITVNGYSVSNMPGNLILQGDVFIDRIYDFSGQTSVAASAFGLTSNTLQDRDCDGINDQLVVYWNPIDGAEEYQLEWTYINDYNLSGVPDIDFSQNATRISTTQTSYSLSLVFDRGYVCFRIRAVGRSLTAPYRYLYTSWTTPDGSAVANSMANYHITTAPYDVAKNWQYSTTYAEEGKKKEVISFYDGSLRNRQMVTKINSDHNTIVGETLYDRLGRPMIQVLPAPVSSPDCQLSYSETALKYYANFNQNNDGNSYSVADFDPENPGDNCVPSIAPIMGTASGTSNYYSSSNPNTNGSQAYVPDANGYPFSQVQYMPDNTGRVRSQGGVGLDFQLGSGHETNYFYAHPFQEQLDRLFGSEVGDASHYQKNMVIDPNGQVSVSYLDQEGRVVATSLAGESPENLEALSSQNSARIDR